MDTYISNGFSLNMIDPAALAAGVVVYAQTVDAGEARCFVGHRRAESIIGHADIAAVVTDDLGVAVAHNRATRTLYDGDSMLVAQYRGPRLPEGTTALPAGTAVEYVKVLVGYDPTSPRTGHSRDEGCWSAADYAADLETRGVVESAERSAYAVGGE